MQRSFLAAIAIGASLVCGSADAGVTAPTAGTVIRDEGPVNIVEAVGGRYSNNTAAILCNNSNAVRTPQAKGDLQVIRQSDLSVAHSFSHPTPNNFSAALANANAPYSTTWDTTGAAAGTYRILSTAITNVTKPGSVFVPNSGQCSGSNQTLSDFTVEFRPWQYVFTDLLGQGKVSMNVDPAEYQASISGLSGDVVDGSTTMRFFSAPDDSNFVPDPELCISDPAACLPTDALECDPSGDCEPRFIVVNQPANHPDDVLFGIFDLGTGAFIALGRVDGHSRLLLSAGRDLDPLVHSVIAALAAGANSFGIDLVTLLSTKIELHFGNPTGPGAGILSISLLQGIELIQGMNGGSPGVRIGAPFALNAGWVTHTIAYAPATNPVFVPGPCSGFDGYHTSVSALVPTLPPTLTLLVGALPALVLGPEALFVEPGGPFMNVQSSNYPPGRGSHSVGAPGLGNSLDTSPGAPYGLPFWMPILSAGSTVGDSAVDFMGHTLLVISIPEVNLGPLGCFGGGGFTGFGLSIFGKNPLPQFKNLPLLFQEQPQAIVDLVAAINEVTGPGGPLDTSELLAILAPVLGGGAPDLEALLALLESIAGGGLPPPPAP